MTTTKDAIVERAEAESREPRLHFWLWFWVSVVTAGAIVLTFFVILQYLTGQEREREIDALADAATANATNVERLRDQLLDLGETPVVSGPEPVPGPPGETGATGPRGPAGPAGPPGRDGRDGTDGAGGPPGPPGADGSDGVDGAPGTDGTDGAQGEIGPQGPPGPAGPAGPPGPTGPAGPPGPECPEGYTQYPFHWYGRDGIDNTGDEEDWVVCKRTEQRHGRAAILRRRTHGRPRAGRGRLVRGRTDGQGARRPEQRPARRHGQERR